MRRIFVLLALASFAAAAAAQSATAPKELTIEAIFAEGGLTGRAPSGFKWSPDATKLTYVQRDESGERGELRTVDLAKGESVALVASEKLARLAPPISKVQDERERERRLRYAVAEYHWSPDSKHLLFDAREQLWLYTLETGTAVAVTSGTEAPQDPKFSPDGARLAYVRGHDLWVQRLDERRPKRLTRREHDQVLNGVVDWLYAEELDVRSNYFWSPDGKQIAYLQMDERPVPEHPITNLVPVRAAVDMQKYPQAGDRNPRVRLGVVGSGGGRTRWIRLPGQPENDDEGAIEPGSEADIYIPRFGWLRDRYLYVYVLNREQTKLDLYFVDARSGRPRLALSEQSDDAWVNVHDFELLPSGDGFVWLGWGDGYTHIFLYRFDPQDPLRSEARLERQLTRGEFEVTKIDAVTEDAVFFTAASPDARERQLFRVALGGGEPERISQAPGTHSAEFSPDGKRYLHKFSDLASPPRLAVCEVGGACRTFWESRSLHDHGVRAPEFIEFKAEDGNTLYGSLLLPEKLAAGERVPVILHPYGGPTGQVVRNEWGGNGFLFHQLLVRAGFAVLRVDNRGTPARGRRFNAFLKGRFGDIELRDQLAALQQAAERFPLDLDRVGLYGGSYGGFVTLYAMTHSNAIHAGVSIAPVTDWRDYDTAYTERYLGLPQRRGKEYEASSVVDDADALSGSLLLAHGTSDDNVHFQNSIQMADALIKAGKQFDFIPYPGKTHGIRGARELTHLYTRIMDHFQRELKGSRRSSVGSRQQEPQSSVISRQSSAKASQAASEEHQ